MATLADSGSVKLKAGAAVSTALTNAHYIELIEQAEADICVESRYDWITNSGSSFISLVKDAITSKAAVHAIDYDTTNYFSENTAQQLKNTNWGVWENAVRKLKDKIYVDWMVDN